MNKKSLIFRIIITVIIIVLLTSAAVLGIYLKSVHNYKEKVAGTQISEIDVRKIPDRTYIGDYDVGFIYAKVEVVVKSGSIASIKLLEHKNERGSSAESIISEIIRAQSLNVDTVSGATNSSIVIKKTVEIALTKGKA